MEDGTSNENLEGDLGGGTGDGGNNAPAWKAQLKGDLRDNEFFNQFGTVSDMGGRILELDGKLKNAIILPGENATPEEIEAFYAAQGKPAKPEDYSVTKPKDWPEEVPYPQESEAWFKGFAHKYHISNKVAGDMYNDFMATYSESVKKELAGKADLERQNAEKVEQDQTKAIESLKSEYGENYKDSLVIADRAIDTFSGGDKEFRKFLDDSGFGNDLRMIKMFVTIGKALSEDSGIFSEFRNKGESRKGVLHYPSMETK